MGEYILIVMSEKYSIEPYEPTAKNQWDNHIRNSKNTNFFFLRDYIEYHQNRFQEHSLIIRKGQKIVAVLPGNILEDTYISYQGLTFGGLIASDKMRSVNTGTIMGQIVDYLSHIGVKKMIYRKMPYIYSTSPFEEDEYHLVHQGAVIHSIEIGQVIDYDNYRLSSTRKNEIRRAEGHEIKIVEEDKYSQFWALLESNLTKHGASPTHTLEEISYLASKFPQNIKLYCAQKGDELLCGTVLFLNESIAHTQYIGSSETAHDYFALEYLLHVVIEQFKSKRYFSFGISTEQKGKILNQGLAFFKEGFGARGVVNVTYSISLA